MSDPIVAAIELLQSKAKAFPDIGIICGSGLGGLAETLQDPVHVDYSDIPGFSRSTVKGHAGILVFGYLGGKYVMCMKGRFHFYEGYHPTKVAYPVKVMAAMGIKMLIVTNAAGGLNINYRVGDLMILKDHICVLGFSGINPLVGPVDSRFGPRFPACNQYDPHFIKLFNECAVEHKIKVSLREGTYVGLAGPNYESPAEVKYLRVVGGDAVGMSTVFEVQMAAQCGLPVLGVSLITNRAKGPGDDWEDPCHEEVLEAGRKVQDAVQQLVSVFAAKIDLSKYPRPKAFTYLDQLSPPPPPPPQPPLQHQLQPQQNVAV